MTATALFRLCVLLCFVDTSSANCTISVNYDDRLDVDRIANMDIDLSNRGGLSSVDFTMDGLDLSAVKYANT